MFCSSDRLTSDWRVALRSVEASFLDTPSVFVSILFNDDVVLRSSSTLKSGVSTTFAPPFDDALLGKFTGLTNVCWSREALWTKKELGVISDVSLVPVGADSISFDSFVAVYAIHRNKNSTIMLRNLYMQWIFYYM